MRRRFNILVWWCGISSLPLWGTLSLLSVYMVSSWSRIPAVLRRIKKISCDTYYEGQKFNCVKCPLCLPSAFHHSSHWESPFVWSKYEQVSPSYHLSCSLPGRDLDSGVSVLWLTPCCNLYPIPCHRKVAEVEGEVCLLSTFPFPISLMGYSFLLQLV